VTLEEILKGVNLTSDVREALESRTGELGTLLLLSEALETSDGEACHDLTEKLAGADHMVINACLTQALAWASNIGRENE